MPGAAGQGNVTSTQGWATLPGGAIIQWGEFAFGSSGTWTNFPRAFPNACLSFVATDRGGSTPSVNNVINSDYNATQYAVWSPFAPHTCKWIAIGY